MKPRRVIAAALLGSLVATLPASADRRRRRVAQPEEEQTAREDQDGPEATQQLGARIEDLVEIAVRLSPELARSRQDRNAARGQANASRKEQQWVVSANANLERFSTNVDLDAELRPFDTVAENKLVANLGIGRNLPTGGNLSLDFGVTRLLREFAVPAQFGVTQENGTVMPGVAGIAISDQVTFHQAQAKLTFKQPIARGFGPDVALAAQKKGDLAAAEATVRTQIAAEEMLRDIVVGYWELAFSDYEVQERANSVLAAKKQQEQTAKEVRVGKTSEDALKAIEFEIYTRDEALLDAKGQYEKKSMELRRRVGMELTQRAIVIRPLEKFQVEVDEFDADEVITRARKGNRKVAAAILQKRQAEFDVKVAKNGMLPQVDFTVSGALIGQGSTADAAFSRAGDGGNYLVSAGLSVQFEIGGAAKGAHDAAMAKRARVEVDQLDIARSVDVEIVHAVNQVKAARARVALTEKAVTLAEANVRAEGANFAANRSTMFNVMERQTDLFNSRLRMGRAIADYHIAVAQVQFHGGMLLEQYGVDVRPNAKARKSPRN
jgi:outer membrane protein TolC